MLSMVFLILCCSIFEARCSFRFIPMNCLVSKGILFFIHRLQKLGLVSCKKEEEGMLFRVLMIFCKLTFGLAKSCVERALFLWYVGTHLCLFYVSFPSSLAGPSGFCFQYVECQRGVVEFGSSDPLVCCQRDDVGVGLVLVVKGFMQW